MAHKPLYYGSDASERAFLHSDPINQPFFTPIQVSLDSSTHKLFKTGSCMQLMLTSYFTPQPSTNEEGSLPSSNFPHNALQNHKKTTMIQCAIKAQGKSFQVDLFREHAESRGDLSRWKRVSLEDCPVCLPTCQVILSLTNSNQSPKASESPTTEIESRWVQHLVQACMGKFFLSIISRSPDIILHEALFYPLLFLFHFVKTLYHLLYITSCSPLLRQV